MKELTEGDKKLLSDIDKFGWHVVTVMSDEQGPGFGYSVGLYHSFGHPEVIMIGLKPELTHVLINNIGQDIKQGKLYSDGQFYSDILDDFNCLMITVDQKNYRDYVGYGIWYYESDNFPLIQCIYPTVKGIYPWDKKLPEDIKDIQPLLGEIKMNDENGG